MIGFAAIVGLVAWGALIYYLATDKVMRDSLRRKR